MNDTDTQTSPDAHALTPIKIAVIQGTTRKLRRSINAARFVAKVGAEIPGVEIIFVDIANLNVPLDTDGNDPDGKDPAYTKITEEADAYFIVVPEYNHSFPGSLKRVLDSELKTYNHKPVAFAGVSSGKIGGARAIEQLVLATRETGMAALSVDVHFPEVQNLFDEQGNLLDDAYERRVKRIYTELIWMAKTLKWGRENL
jgi:NAD(P)H-dependent FMN reductase